MKKKLFTLLTLLCLCVTGAWGDDVVIATGDFSSSNKPQNGINLISGNQTYGVLSCNSASSNRALIRNNSSLTVTATKEGYTLKKIVVVWRNNYAATEKELVVTGGTLSGNTTINCTSGATEVVLGSPNREDNNAQIISATVTYESTSSTTTTYSVTHTLSHVTASSGATGANAATAGTIYTAVFSASSDYKLPDAITVTIGGNVKTVDTDYTWNSSTGTVTIPAANVTGAIVISVTGVALQKYSVTHTLSNVTTTSGDTGAAVATEGSDYTAVFAAETGYDLPTTIDVTIGGNAATSGTDYTWNSSTGAFQVPAAKVTGNIVVTIAGVAVQTYTITYEKGEGVTGVVPPADANKVSGTIIKLPKNFTMYKEGYTMTGWDEDGDGIADYLPGANYTVTGTKTLTAVFTSNNGVTLADRNTATTVKFEFQRGEGAPTIAWGEGSGAHLWVGQASVNGNTIDVKADINVTASGKMANGSWTDWMQINNTTEFTLPSAENAVVNARVYSDKNTSTVNGNTRNSISSNIATFNVTSSASTSLFIASATESGYYKYIEVVLPPTLTTESDRTWDFTSATEFTDAASADKTYSAETRVNNLLIGNGATLTKDNQRLKLNNQGTSSQYYVKIKAAAHSKITVSAVGGSKRNVTFAENAVGGKVLGTVDCTNSSAQDKVLMDTGDGDKIICIYNSNSGNITLYSITVEEYTASAPTAVTVTPSPAAAYKDASITLTATADGAPTPTITWYQCDDAEKTNPVSKGTGTTYNPATNVAGTFYFYAEAENASGSAASAVVTLTVTDPNKYNVGNAYYFTNGEAAVNGEKIYGDDITVELTGANGGLNNAATEGSVATLDANYVAVVTGKDGGNGWGPTFTPAVDGTVTLGAFFNGDNSRKVKITNVTSFIYQNNGDEEATVNNSDEYIPSAVFRGLVTFDVEAGTTYAVSFSGSKMGFYGFEFTPEKVAVTKRNDRTYGTFVATKALDFTNVTDMEAYIAKGLNGAGNAVTIEKVTKVPAGTAIIVKTAVKTTASVNVPVTSTATAADVEGNLLVAGDGTTAWNGTDNVTYYYLANDQFHKGTSGTLQTGKAYLQVPGNPELAKAMTIFIGEGETTAINGIEEVAPATMKTRKVVKNGRLVIETANGEFTIDGARVK